MADTGCQTWLALAWFDALAWARTTSSQSRCACTLRTITASPSSMLLSWGSPVDPNLARLSRHDNQCTWQATLITLPEQIGLHYARHDPTQLPHYRRDLQRVCWSQDTWSGGCSSWRPRESTCCTVWLPPSCGSANQTHKAPIPGNWGQQYATRRARAGLHWWASDLVPSYDGRC